VRLFHCAHKATHASLRSGKTHAPLQKYSDLVSDAEGTLYVRT
jgi:hypothetical protein